MFIFDIETGPLSDDEVRQNIPPFEPEKKHPGEFDPSKIKYGQMGEAKRAEKLEKCKQKHQELIDEYEAELVNGEEAYFVKAMNKAALSAATGRVLAIGVLDTSITSGPNVAAVFSKNEGEAKAIARFWQICDAARESKTNMVGLNIKKFDLPFLIQRSAILGVAFPNWIMERFRYFHPMFIDIMEAWNCGNTNGYTSADTICRAMGLPGKNGNGKDFAQLLENDPATAVAYLKNDLAILVEPAKRLGVV